MDASPRSVLRRRAQQSLHRPSLSVGALHNLTEVNPAIFNQDGFGIPCTLNKRMSCAPSETENVEASGVLLPRCRTPDRSKPTLQTACENDGAEEHVEPTTFGTPPAWDTFRPNQTFRHRYNCLSARRNRDNGTITEMEFRDAVLESGAKADIDEPFAAEYFVDVKIARTTSGHYGSLTRRKAEKNLLLAAQLEQEGLPSCAHTGMLATDPWDEIETSDDDDFGGDYYSEMRSICV